jgi:hypothetical protein
MHENARFGGDDLNCAAQLRRRSRFGKTNPMSHSGTFLLTGARRCLGVFAKPRISPTGENAKRTQWHIRAHCGHAGDANWEVKSAKQSQRNIPEHARRG